MASQVEAAQALKGLSIGGGGQREAVQALLQRAKGLNEFAQRGFAAMVGCVVGDAAAVRTHWCYDRDALRSALEGKEAAFAEEALNPFYRVAPGRSSCYGDQLRCVVRSMARQPGGAFDARDLAVALEERMTREDYEATAATRAARAAYADDQRATAPPVDGPWRHGTIERFLRYEVDHSDASADALVRAIPVAARFARDGGHGVLPAVDAAVRATQFSTVARSHAAVVAIAVSHLCTRSAKTPREAVEKAAAHPVCHAASETFVNCLAAAGEPTFDGSVEALRDRLGFGDKPLTKLVA